MRVTVYFFIVFCIYNYFFYLSLSRCMSLATSYPRVTAHTWQEGYASLHNSDIENQRRFLLFVVKTSRLNVNFMKTVVASTLYSHEMCLYIFLCCCFRDRTHKQGVSGLQRDRNARSARHHHRRDICSSEELHTYPLSLHAFHLWCITSQQSNCQGQIQNSKYGVQPKQVVSGETENM